MKLKLTLQNGANRDDIVVSTDSRATVRELARHLHRSRSNTSDAEDLAPLTLRVSPGAPNERVLPGDIAISDAGVRSGDTVALTTAEARAGDRSATVATLHVLAGPDEGKQFELPVGTSLLGRDRDCEVRLTDPLVSRRHAKVNVSDAVEIINDRSSNGVEVDGALVERAVLGPQTHATIGDTVVAVKLHTNVAAADGKWALNFNRSPRLDPTYAGTELVAPEPPQRPQPQRFPWISIVAPLLMGVILYAVTRSLLSILFIGLSPIMLGGAFFEGRRSQTAELKRATEEFRGALAALVVDLQYAHQAEREARQSEHPAVDSVTQAIDEHSPLLWTRRPEHARFGEVRFGLGRQASRNRVKLPETNRTTPELWRELNEAVGSFGTVDRVPVVASLRDGGNIGIAGPATSAAPVAAGLLLQFAGLHSPAEVVVAAIANPSSAARWEWTKWLPHVGSEFSPLDVGHLAANDTDRNALVAALEGLVRDRRPDGGENEAPPLPTILVVVVDDDTMVDRTRLVQIAERGPAAGIHLIWVAPSIERVPAACRSFVTVDPTTGNGSGGFVHTSEGVDPIELEPVSLDEARRLARRLSATIDAGALLDDQTDLPRSVSLLELAGGELADDPSEVLATWQASNSLPAPTAPKLTRDNHLRALIGASSSGSFAVDLRADGPHALVGGTTGAGKSEFLQSWILSLAATHSPLRVNFLFVDYKGGSAFAECVNLPHSVGLVTDLSTHLVHRALRSLRAELRRREHILNDKKAKDLLDLERRRDPEAPPSLIIVVDEFAALVAEVPEFVDGVVDIAQRGRSLGLHLILATQRPAGVIKDNLRANTNLRVALRMADADDSTDVVGSPVAASFDTSIPGRGVVKTGPARVVSFQSAYVGGRTTDEPPPPIIDVHDFAFGSGAYWVPPEADEEPTKQPENDDKTPPDIARIVDNITTANSHAGLEPARRPWLPELSATYRLEDLPTQRTDEELVFGVIDMPDSQTQPTLAFHPDRDGNMVVYGASGTGKSTFLRSVAVAAAFAPARGGPCNVYALDFGGRGLSMIEELPNVGSVINGEDDERVARLLKHLRAMIDERSSRYAEHNAATITEYRKAAHAPDEPRTLLLLDNVGAFRQTYETGRGGSMLDLLESIAADGRAVGVHVVLTADQVNSLTTSLRSVVQSQVVLRMASENDLLTLGVPAGVFSEHSPPGRGYTGSSDVQIAVLGGTQSVANQAKSITMLADASVRAGVPAAPEIRRLGTDISRSKLRAAARRSGAFAIWDETLEPISFEPRGCLVVAGPLRSGRTTTVTTLLEALTDQGSPGITIISARTPEVHVPDAAIVLTAASPDFAERVKTLTADINGTTSGDLAHAVVIERLTQFGFEAEDALTELLRAVRMTDQLAIVEDETRELAGGFGTGLLSTAKADRHGILLQPDASDGDTVFNVDLPRISRADFPPGRGFYINAGRARRVQILRPASG